MLCMCGFFFFPLHPVVLSIFNSDGILRREKGNTMCNLEYAKREALKLSRDDFKADNIINKCKALDK